MNNHQTFYSNGKLLLTGEYVVLDGALALAIPTKFGQSLQVKTIIQPKIIWQSFDEKNNLWFEETFCLDLNDNPSNDISKRIIQILIAAKQLNPKFLNTGIQVSTHLTFPRNWGLGTSSTLINNIAQWANVDAYKLLKQSFGGSGYDIACAQSNSSITYQLKHKIPMVAPVDFNPKFKDSLYFVYLNQKQNSRDGIAHYNNNKNNIGTIIQNINSITLEMINCRNLENFAQLINRHETLIANITKQETITSKYFPDFNGSIKSLGAWGGDFVLVAAAENPTNYFKEKGFDVVLRYNDMVL
ncbi:MAG: GYDIA family GHMP kinase [Aestuariibaculum sp.]